MQHRRSLTVVRGLVAAIATTASLTSSALAGIADSPIPAPFTKHVYSVAGVINGGGIGSYFQCTNADKVSVTVGVEVFGPAGGSPLNNAATTAISLAPGATVIFGTQGATGITIDANLATGLVSKGSARILATSTKLICTAFWADVISAPTTSSANLTIVKKTKQRGD